MQKIYTENLMQKIKRKEKTALAQYLAATALFVALCVGFCLLAAYELVNVYVCCVVNVVFSVVFMWYSYLFFSLYFKAVREKAGFVNCLENALPSQCEYEYLGVEKEDAQYTTLNFCSDNAFKLDKNVKNVFVVGKRYRMEIVKDVIVSFGEVDDE